MISHSYKILLVDDSLEDRATYRRYLRSSEKPTYEILEADTGELALQICQQSLPDLIVLDYCLPDQDGLTFFQTFTQQFGQFSLPILLLTGEGSERVAVQAIKQGVADYHVKNQITADNFHQLLVSTIQQFQWKQITHRLQEQENLLNLFVQYAPVGIAMFDREMRYLMASQRWIDEYSLGSMADLLGRSHYEVFPDIPDEWRQIHQRCLAGATERGNREGLRRKWTTWEARPWYQGTGEIGGIIIFVVDITQQKETELALQTLNAQLEQRVQERTQALSQSNHYLQESITQLEVSEKQLADLYQNAPCGYHSLNADGLIININNTELDWLGYSREEVVNRKHFHEFLTPVGKELFRQNFPLLKERGWVKNLELKLIHRDGSSRWLMFSVTAIRDEAGNFVMTRSISLDITERKQAKLALQKQTQQQFLWQITQKIRHPLDLDTILQTTVAETRQILQGDRVAVYRFRSDWSGEFIAESVGDRWVKLVTTEVSTVCQDTYLQATQGDCFQNPKPCVVVNIYEANLQPCHISLLEQFQAKAYIIVPLFAWEELWGLLAIYQNTGPRHWQGWEVELFQQIAQQTMIALQKSHLYHQLATELRKNQQQTLVLQEAERRWRSLLENIQLLVVEINNLGKIQYANPYFLALTEYQASEILEKDWFTFFIPPLYQDRQRQEFAKVFNSHFQAQNEFVIRGKNGQEKLIAWNHTPLRDLDGQIIGIISLGEDITERHRTEQIKNEFIGIVSHELRTPLSGIQMSLGLLNTGIYDHDLKKIHRILEIALLDTNRLSNLVNDMLDLERLESGRSILEKQVCDAMDLIKQSSNGMQAIARKNHIHLEIIPTSIRIWAAPDSIIQILTNLLSNALKFSPPHTTIQLRVDRQGKETIWQVRDQGRGIPPDKLEAIFDRFQQVDASDAREKGGTGLGLSICRTIVERHGGRIWVESILGQGSAFYFTLPISNNPPNDP